MELGYYDMPDSYLKFLIQSLTGLNASQRWVDIFAVFFLGLAFGASILTNMRGWKKKRKSPS